MCVVGLSFVEKKGECGFDKGRCVIGTGWDGIAWRNGNDLCDYEIGEAGGIGKKKKMMMISCAGYSRRTQAQKEGLLIEEVSFSSLLAVVAGISCKA